MPKKRLTEEGVAKLKAPPTGKQVDYYDAVMPGLVLRLNYGGKKTWRALYYVPSVAKSGKRKGQRISMPTTRELGRYPILRLKEARDKARQFLADPQQALAQADTGSFQEVADNFIKRHVAKNGLRSQPHIERLLRNLVHPSWGHRPFRDLRRSDVIVLLDTIEDRHGARQADIVLAIIRSMMNWYAARNDDYVCPVVRGMHRYDTAAHKRDRWLTDEEVKALWTACDGVGTFGSLVKVLLLTGQRRTKVQTMQWDDIADGVWTIRSEKREKTNAGRIRLPQLALDIIAAQPRIAGNPYVFAGRGDRPFDVSSVRKTELDETLAFDSPWVLHDLRRTARKLMTRAKVRPDVAELALGHSIKGIQATYDDREEYGAMVDDAIQRVADEVAKILHPPSGNVVVPLRR
jgi:integrase